MYEGKHIHFSPVDNRPLCSYSGKLCRQRRVNGYAFCIRHILEDKTAPFKQCAHVAKYNNQKCTNPIPSNEDREFCNSHMQVAGMAPKKERKNKKDKEFAMVVDGKLKVSEQRVKVAPRGDCGTSPERFNSVNDPYTFSDVAVDGVCSRKQPMPNCPVVPRSPTNVHDQQNEHVAVKPEPDKGVCTQDRTTCCVSRSPKTVNRLEAKINQNRILDKLKRSRPNGPASASCLTDPSGGEFRGTVLDEEPSGNLRLGEGTNCASLPCEHRGVVVPVVRTSADSGGHAVSASSVHTESAAYIGTRTSSVLKVLPKQPAVKWSWKRPETVPRSLQTFRKLCLEEADLRTDLFPLGLEASDSDNSDNGCDVYQHHWFNSFSDIDSWMSGSCSSTLRSERLCAEKSELRRRCVQLCRSQKVGAAERRAECAVAKALAHAARCQPAGAWKLIDVISTKCCRVADSGLAGKTKKNFALTKQKCCYSNEDAECSNTALPYTRHCVKHIMYNVDQLLFEHCTAKFADNTQCCIPVFDICHELPLCVEHARKRDNYTKLSAEPKPKKPRKKTKPSALTRPPKRGKKKKRQSGRSCEADLPAVLQSSSVVSDVAALHFPMASSDLSPSASGMSADMTDDLDGPMEPDLSTDLDSQLSPGTIDKSLELPIDAAELASQASRLLEDHDFTEVLNKIPDDAFRELFNDGKNGELLPSKEEAEELERALAAVDKDVKSLVKLSSVGHLDLSDSLLHGDHLGVSLDGTLSELSGSGIGIDVIAGSLTSSDLNSISQVLSSMTHDGPLSHIPMLDMSVPHSQPSSLAASGFTVCSQSSSMGRMDDTHPSDSFITVLDSIEESTSNHQWSCDRSQSGHNGLVSPQSFGHTLLSPRFALQHPLLSNSKLESKGRHHYSNLNSGVTTLLETSIGLGSVPIAELTESSTESVS